MKVRFSTRTGCAAAVAAAIVASASLRADVVTDWNQVAEATSVAAGAPPFRSRIMAMVQVAVHDALNAIEPRFESYTGVGPASAGASPVAAVAAASYVVLSQTVPSQEEADAAMAAAKVVISPEDLALAEIAASAADSNQSTDALDVMLGPAPPQESPL